jgi:hypothetical protein
MVDAGPCSAHMPISCRPIWAVDFECGFTHRCDPSAPSVRSVCPIRAICLRATPLQIRIVERAGFDVERLLCPNPEDDGLDKDKSLDVVHKRIVAFKPDVIIAASKGGWYMVEIWKLMEKDDPRVSSA